jgi:hypothetical protein
VTVIVFAAGLHAVRTKINPKMISLPVFIYLLTFLLGWRTLAPNDLRFDVATRANAEALFGIMLREHICNVHNWHRVLAFEMEVDLKAQQSLADALFADVEKVNTTL